jgi:hypothetical protein
MPYWTMTRLKKFDRRLLIIIPITIKEIIILTIILVAEILILSIRIPIIIFATEVVLEIEINQE